MSLCKGCGNPVIDGTCACPGVVSDLKAENEQLKLQIGVHEKENQDLVRRFNAECLRLENDLKEKDRQNEVLMKEAKEWKAAANKEREYSLGVEKNRNEHSTRADNAERLNGELIAALQLSYDWMGREPVDAYQKAHLDSAYGKVLSILNPSINLIREPHPPRAEGDLAPSGDAAGDAASVSAPAGPVSRNWKCAKCGKVSQFKDGLCWGCFGGDPGQ